MELDTDMTGFSDGTLYLNFKLAPSVVAGKPYIIKLEVESNNNASSYFNSRAFGDVTATAAGNTSVTSIDGKVSFCGTFSPITFTNDRSILYLGSNNTLYWPEGEVTINAFRAYFKLNDITAGDLNPARPYVLNVDDETTSVDSLPLNYGRLADSWYTLDGRRLSSKPSKSGLYVVNGKKVVVK